MCGIVGVWSADPYCDPEALSTLVSHMGEALVHRGPDDSGVWCDSQAGLALGHRRLAVLDISSAGHQPMISSCGRFVIVFNGEIYNHAAVTCELEQLNGKFEWQGHSDTEVILEAISQWGISAALNRFVGMFALALWDRKHKRLHLVRDRLGEKPFYYGWKNGTLMFASELKALKCHPLWTGEIDRDALSLFLRYSYVPAPYSIYKGIKKLPPGQWLQLNHSTDQLTRPRSYWSANNIAEAGLAHPFNASEKDTRDELERLLLEAVKGQMVADVPLGAFLSGGIDSSTITALMQTQSERPVRTFTIGFHEDGYDESRHASAVAKHLGTEHTELYVTSKQAQDVIPRLPMLYDEPFGDSSQIPTFLISELAQSHVTVALSGDGGDELFGGYNRYFWASNLWRKVGWVPMPLRTAMASILTCISPSSWSLMADKIAHLMPTQYHFTNPGDKLHKLAEILTARNREMVYLGLVSLWKNPSDVVLGATEPMTLVSDSTQRPSLSDFENHMMLLDLATYLPDDILVKVDRAAMGVSLETRVPFLDHRVVEFAWRIPLSMKIRNGQGKWILRQVLYQYIPKELIERPKMGFGIPIDKWLRGPLRQWAEALLDKERLVREGFFDPNSIRQKWQEHLSGKRAWQHYLWNIIMFQAWLEAEKK